MLSSRRAFVIGATALCATAPLTGCVRGTEDPAKSRRFSTFLTTLLAGKTQPTGMDDAMQRALTPNRILEIRHTFAPFGTFQRLQFLGEDEVQGYRRYHYIAIFSQGKQGTLFVLDSLGKIGGFFEE